MATSGNGDFQFFGIVPGAYRVLAVGGAPDNPATAIQELEIRPGTTPEITLELQHGIDIRGQVYANGRTPSNFKSQQLTVMLELAPELRHNPRLRGIQTTDGNGRVTFTTVYPGWYQGRATHIHVEVTLNGASVKVTQIAFPEIDVRVRSVTLVCESMRPLRIT